MTMLFRPNPSSGVPIYLQLTDQFRLAARTGALLPGETLPAVSPLARHLVVHPNTVVRAYRQLEREGVVEARDGVDTWVALPAIADWASAAQPPEVTALSLENRRLAAEVASEVAERIKRTRELETARDVQQRLLPQECAAVGGLDYSGSSRPALGVGGDYYDFLRLSDATLGIAIGDVSGKGMPAALLMATIRGYLHSQTLHPSTDLAVMMTALNRLVYESSAPNRYATFFYGQYDAGTRQLRYVNAGHHPPLIVRDGQIVASLETGGPAIGLMDTSRYTVGVIDLEPGDLLVAFTDGIPEALNGHEEEFGEARLQELLRTVSALAAREVVSHLIGAADGFATGAPQYDDMTVVAVRLT